MKRFYETTRHHPVIALFILFTVCVLIFLVTIPVPRADGLLIGSDGVLYYQYVRSLVIDGDLDFTNEYLYYWGPAGVPDLTPADLPPNRMSIGMGIVWTPFFLLAHALSWLLGLPMNGYSGLYQAAVCLGSMIYGFIGLVMTYYLCREYVDSLTAVVAVVVIWLSSNVIYYLVIEPSMSHMASLGAVASLLAWWRLRRDQTSWVYWIVLGVLGGLATLIRPQDVLFLVLPAIQWLLELLDSGRRYRVVAHIGHGVLFVLSWFSVFCVQIWAWWLVYGSIRESGYLYGAPQSFHWLTPKIPQVLFSLYHGLFTWHPVYFIGAFGLIWVLHKDRRYGALLMFALALQVYLVSVWREWWQGDAFGGRMFIATVPIFAIGLALIIEQVRNRGGWPWVIVPSTALVAWNFAFVIQYRFDFIPMGEPITLAQLTWGKLSMPFQLLDYLRH